MINLVLNRVCKNFLYTNFFIHFTQYLIFINFLSLLGNFFCLLVFFSFLKEYVIKERGWVPRDFAIFEMTDVALDVVYYIFVCNWVYGHCVVALGH